MPGAKRVTIGINRAGRHIGDKIRPEDIIVRAGARRQSRCQRDQAGCDENPAKIAMLANDGDPFTRFNALFSRFGYNSHFTQGFMVSHRRPSNCSPIVLARPITALPLAGTNQRR
jgi:hypothetical protein